MVFATKPKSYYKGRDNTSSLTSKRNRLLTSRPFDRFPKHPCWATLNIDTDHGHPGLYAYLSQDRKEWTIYHSDYTSKGPIPDRKNAEDNTRNL